MFYVVRFKLLKTTAQPCTSKNTFGATGSTNSERRTTPAREGFVSTNAFTEPDAIGISAVYVNDEHTNLTRSGRLRGTTVTTQRGRCYTHLKITTDP